MTFKIYNNGISAETQSSTDDATEFLQDVATYLAKEFGLEVPSAPYLKKGYVSQVDVECDVALTTLNPKLTPFFQRLNEHVKTLDGIPRQFDLAAIQGWTEDVNQQMAPAMFRFERKLGSPFSSHQYFTQSALETQEHIDLLNELVALLKT